MLETYLEEVERKRRGRRVFWFAVFVSSAFLYLFFQGYYPYVRIDLSERIGWIETPSQKPQVVRAFGIITVRTTPSPDRISVRLPDGTQRTLENDEKGFFNFGDHSVMVEKHGYLPVRLELTLDKANAFSINAFDLLKYPEPAEFAYPIDRFDAISDEFAIVRERGDGKAGRIYRTLDAKLEAIPWTAFRTDARPMGGGYFEKDGIVFAFDTENKTLRSAYPLTGSGSEPCHGAAFEGSSILCPETGRSMPAKSAGFARRLFGFGGHSIRTDDMTVHMENGRILGIERPMTGISAAKSASGETFPLGGKSYRFLSGSLVPASTKASKYETGGLDSIASIHAFGKETLMVGTLSDKTAFDLIDEHGYRFVREIPAKSPESVTVQNLAGAYVFAGESDLVIYYKASPAPMPILSGAEGFIGFWNGSVLFKKDGDVFRLPLEMGETAETTK